VKTSKGLKDPDPGLAHFVLEFYLFALNGIDGCFKWLK
jgi:hypothetical protein